MLSQGCSPSLSPQRCRRAFSFSRARNGARRLRPGARESGACGFLCKCNARAPPAGPGASPSTTEEPGPAPPAACASDGGVGGVGSSTMASSAARCRALGPLGSQPGGLLSMFLPTAHHHGLAAPNLEPLAIPSPSEGYSPPWSAVKEPRVLSALGCQGHRAAPGRSMGSGGHKADAAGSRHSRGSCHVPAFACARPCLAWGAGAQLC